MNQPTISVIVPVHTSTRPIYRAVQSVLEGASEKSLEAVEVVVVCHEVSLVDVGKNLGDLMQSPSVTLLEFQDGVKSPAGPINHGIRHAKGKWILVMGSDDFLEPNFLESYLTKTSNSPELDVLLLPIKLSNGDEYFACPVPQYGFRQNLQTIRDRLFYRTAPSALVRRQLLMSDQAELYTEKVRNGEDLIHSTWLWTHAKHIHMNRTLPHYIVGDDATDRVTLMSYSAQELRKPLELLTGKPWFVSLPSRTLNAFGIKYLRSNILSRDWDSLGSESKKDLIDELMHLDSYCNLDKKSLSITENMKLRKMTNYEKSGDKSAWWEKSILLQRIARIFPASVTRILSPNSWSSISTDIILGNLLWLREKPKE